MSPGEVIFAVLEEQEYRRSTRYIIYGWVGMTIWYITLYRVGVVKNGHF